MKPSSGLFPGVPGNVFVHNGFRDTHSVTAPAILAEVKDLIRSRNATSVVAVSPNLFRFAWVRGVITDRDRLQVGHSLGGAIAELDTVYFRLNLPRSVTVRGVTYGTPRVGNPAWANWFNSMVGIQYTTFPETQLD